MLTVDMERQNNVFVLKHDHEDTGIKQFQMKTETTGIETSNIITVRIEDGSEECYIPCLENGQLVLTPLATNVSCKEEGVGLVDQDEDFCEQKPILHGNSLIEDKQPKFINYDGKIVRTVPIPKQEPRKNARVPPNTYKKYLINNGSQKRYERRNVLLDHQTKIGPKAFKQQLMYSADLLTPLHLAPRNKQQMRHMVDGFTKLFGYPVHSMSKKMRRLYTKHCTTQKQPNCSNMDDMQLLPIGYQVDIDRSKVKRITRRRRYPEVEELKRKQAELQKLESVTLGDNQIQVLLDAANKTNPDCVKMFSDDAETSNDQQIVIIHDGEETAEGTAYTHKNIEVLLAAAAESRGKDIEDVRYEQVFICDEGMQEQLLADSNQIIIVHEEGEENEGVDNVQIIETHNTMSLP